MRSGTLKMSLWVPLRLPKKPRNANTPNTKTTSIGFPENKKKEKIHPSWSCFLLVSPNKQQETTRNNNRNTTNITSATPLFLFIPEKKHRTNQTKQNKQTTKQEKPGEKQTQKRQPHKKNNNKLPTTPSPFPSLVSHARLRGPALELRLPQRRLRAAAAAQRPGLRGLAAARRRVAAWVFWGGLGGGGGRWEVGWDGVLGVRKTVSF